MTMTDAPSLLDVADQLAIRDLLADFADAVNRMSPDDLRNVFVPDGEWIVTGWGEHCGHDDIVDFLAGLLQRWEMIFHAVHSGRVNLEGDRATGRWYISEFGRLEDGTEVRFAGVYHDEYVRVAGGWRFARRRYDGMFARIGDQVTTTPFPSL
jgi:ketosteroid isomerase-like protein